MLVLLAIFNACTIIKRFTRIAGELFGMLIAVLFMQEAVKGLINEFKIPKGESPSKEKYNFQWKYVNGLLAIIFAFGVLFSSLKSRRMRSSPFGPGWVRSFTADYEVPLLIVKWSAFTELVPDKVPAGVPRRLCIPSASNLKIVSSWANNPEYGISSYSIHLRCNHPSYNDSRSLFFRPQCRFPNGTTEGI
ncbi:putative boron transporter 7 isoform X1 [Apium graveolens]|uniref:putative boron transporter 7 isoform X1 n=1 Tax=Apium graveolens TaxID=4045 RepID=UPI003D7BF517